MFSTLYASHKIPLLNMLAKPSVVTDKAFAIFNPHFLLQRNITATRYLCITNFGNKFGVCCSYSEEIFDLMLALKFASTVGTMSDSRKKAIAEHATPTTTVTTPAS